MTSLLKFRFSLLFSRWKISPISFLHKKRHKMLKIARCTVNWRSIRDLNSGDVISVLSHFECDLFDLLSNAPYVNLQKSFPEKGEKSRREQQILSCRKRVNFDDDSQRNQTQLPKCRLDFESSTSRYSSYISLFRFALKRLFSVLTLVFDILTYFVLYVARGCLGNIWATIVFRATLFGTTQGKLKICTEFEDLAIFQSKSFFFVWRFYREKHKFCC